MPYRNKQWLHALLVLALLVAPLRTGWAVPVADMVDDGSPCLHMQQDAQSGGMSGDCCDTDCNMHDCNSCVHVSVALPSVAAVTPGVPGSYITIAFIERFSERNSPPLLRPPASL